MLTTIQRRMPNPYVFNARSPLLNQAAGPRFTGGSPVAGGAAAPTYPGDGGGGGGGGAAAPTYPGDGGGGGGGGALSMFQQSVSKERAMNAMRAGTFAANAPLPQFQEAQAQATPADPSTGRSGRADDVMPTAAPPAPVAASGSIPGPAAIDRNSVAARKAYIASKMAEANAEDFGHGPNFFANADEAQAESGRKTRTVESEAGLRDANAGLAGAHARGVDAYTTQGLPAEVAHTRAGTSALNDEVADRQATRPGRVTGQDLQNKRYGAETPLLAAEGQARIQGLNNQNRLGAAMIPPTVAGAYSRLEGEKADVAARRETGAAQNKLLGSQAAQIDKQTAQVGKPIPTDPLSAISAEKERYSLAKQMGQDAGEAAYGDQWFKWLGKSRDENVKEQTQKAYERLRSAGSGSGGDNHPEGATGTHGGRPVVKRNGEWVYTDGK